MDKNWDRYVKHGVFAALFIMLLVYTMNENRAREREYQQTISKVVDVNGKYAEVIKVDLAEIKSKIGR